MICAFTATYCAPGRRWPIAHIIMTRPKSVVSHAALMLFLISPATVLKYLVANIDRGHVPRRDYERATVLAGRSSRLSPSYRHVDDMLTRRAADDTAIAAAVRAQRMMRLSRGTRDRHYLSRKRRHYAFTPSRNTRTPIELRPATIEGRLASHVGRREKMARLIYSSP